MQQVGSGIPFPIQQRRKQGLRGSGVTPPAEVSLRGKPRSARYANSPPPGPPPRNPRRTFCLPTGALRPSGKGPVWGRFSFIKFYHTESITFFFLLLGSEMGFPFRYKYLNPTQSSGELAVAHVARLVGESVRLLRWGFLLGLADGPDFPGRDVQEEGPAASSGSAVGEAPPVRWRAGPGGGRLQPLIFCNSRHSEK